jgi:short-subunit dehydrogenase
MSTALVTGASTGIGRELALLFARDGYDLVLVARNEDALSDVADQVSKLGRAAHVFAADLSGTGSAGRLHERLIAERITVDVLVNNAGVGARGRFDQIPLERQLSMIQLNVVSLTALTHRLLPGMVARNAGGILNVASTAAFQPGPLMTVYYATKAYVLSFTEGVAEELAETGLKITCLAPGPTESEFARTAGMTTARIFRGEVMSAAEVARAGYDGWREGKRLVIPGPRNLLGTLVVRLSPRRMAARIVKGLNEDA